MLRVEDGSVGLVLGVMQPRTENKAPPFAEDTMCSQYIKLSRVRGRLAASGSHCPGCRDLLLLLSLGVPSSDAVSKSRNMWHHVAMGYSPMNVITLCKFPQELL